MIKRNFIFITIISLSTFVHSVDEQKKGNEAVELKKRDLFTVFNREMHHWPKTAYSAMSAEEKKHVEAIASIYCSLPDIAEKERSAKRFLERFSIQIDKVKDCHATEAKAPESEKKDSAWMPWMWKKWLIKTLGCFPAVCCFNSGQLKAHDLSLCEKLVSAEDFNEMCAGVECPRIAVHY